MNKKEIKDNVLTVTVNSFSGHVFIFNGDAIGIIPQYEKIGDKMKTTTRFINFSGYARKFA